MELCLFGGHAWYEVLGVCVSWCVRMCVCTHICVNMYDICICMCIYIFICKIVNARIVGTACEVLG